MNDRTTSRHRARIATVARALLACALFAAVASPARADEVVTLKSGDTITGTLKKVSKKLLEIETAYAGVLQVDWKEVAGLKCDRPLKVSLVEGEPIEGTVAPGPNGALLVQPASGAAVTIDPANVHHIRVLGAAWSGLIDVGFRNTNGNSDTVGALLQGEAIRASEINELKLKGIFRYGENQSSVSEANWYTLGRYRHEIAGPVFAYGSAEFLQDRFKDINLNTILSAGLGVTILEEDWIDLSSELGAAWVRNDFRTNPDEDHVAGRLGADTRITLPLDLEFTDSLIYVPNFETTNDWQLRNEAAFSTAIAAGWKANVGMILEYDNKPEAGFRKDDETYYVGIGYKF